MSISNYKRICDYTLGGLKDFVYLIQKDSLKVKIKAKNADVSFKNKNPNVYKVNSALNVYSQQENYEGKFKFTSTLEVTINELNGEPFFTAIKQLREQQYYIVIEDKQGIQYLVNPELYTKLSYEYTFNDKLDEQNSCVLRFTNLSNFPLLVFGEKTSHTSVFIDTQCNYNIGHISSLRMALFGDLTISNDGSEAKMIYVNDENDNTNVLKDIDYLKYTVSLSEVYDGKNFETSLSFSIPLDNNKFYWSYDTLEFVDNKYSALIKTTNNNHIVIGTEMGLFPSYTIETSEEDDTLNVISFTFTSVSHNPSYFSNKNEVYGWIGDGVTQCFGGYRYEMLTRMVSYDDGETYEQIYEEGVPVIVRKRGELIGQDDECQYEEVKYATIEGEVICEDGNSYRMLMHEESYDNGETWITTATTKQLLQENDAECNRIKYDSYEAEEFCQDGILYGVRVHLISNDGGETWEEDWVETYVKDVNGCQGPDIPTRTRTLTSTPYCKEKDLYVNVKEQISTDNYTWQTVNEYEQLYKLNGCVDSTFLYVDPYFIVIDNTEQDFIISLEGENLIGNSITPSDSVDWVHFIDNIPIDATSTLISVDENTGATRTMTFTFNTDNAQSNTVTIIQSNNADIQEKIISGDSICDGYDLYQHQIHYVSMDGGQSWIMVSEEDVLIERNNKEICHYKSEDEWLWRDYVYPIESLYMCSGTTKHFVIQKQYSKDDGLTWTNSGGTEIGGVYSENSKDCGWSGDEDDPRTTEYRTITSDTVCNGYDLYNVVSQQKKAVTDATWITTATTYELKQENSVICGWKGDDDDLQTKTTQSDAYCDGIKSVADVTTWYRYSDTDEWAVSSVTKVVLSESSTDCYETREYEYPHTEYICVDDDKYSIKVMQYRINGETIWRNSGSTYLGTVIETDSRDCKEPTETGITKTESQDICNGFNLETITNYLYSTDNGQTWQITATTSTLKEANSMSCAKYRTYTYPIEEESYCDGFNAYYVSANQYTVDGVNWTNIGSTFIGQLYEKDSKLCGVVYKWDVLPIEDAWYCEEKEPQYRTINGDQLCDGYDLMQYKLHQVSYDNGDTWTTTATTSVLIEKDSEECGYEPPIYDCCILNYVSTTNLAVEPYDASAIDSPIRSNTYKDGKGTIIFKTCPTEIGARAFSGCSSIKSIELPDSVTSIGYYAFTNGINLLDITIPDSVITIGNYAYQGCFSVKTLTIGNSVTKIGSGAFNRCTGIKTAIIPNSVTSFGQWAFAECTRLEAITYNGTIEQWNAITKGDSWKRNVPTTCIVHCTDGDINI